MSLNRLEEMIKNNKKLQELTIKDNSFFIEL